MPSEKFPVLVLQNSVKMTTEPPKGLRANLLRSCRDFGSHFSYGSTGEVADSFPVQSFHKMLFAICFFHAIVQERRKFGALGWNIQYDWTTGDLKCCVDQLKDFLTKHSSPPYKVLKFLFGQINYGGRVTDDWDRRALMTLLQGFVCP